MKSETQVPNGWEVVRLGEVAEVLTGSTPPREVNDYYGGCTPWVKLSDLATSHLVRTSDEYLTDKGLAISRMVPKGSVLVSCIGTIGEVAIAGVPLCFNQQINALIPSALVTSSFLYWACLTRADYMAAIASKTAVPILNKREFSKTPILLPPLTEQRAISAVLDSIDEAIERTEAVIDAIERLRDALLHDLLTRGVPGWHSEWKEVSGIGTVPACWEVVRLEEVAGVERGKFAYRPRNDPQFYGGAIPFIQTGDVVQANGKINEHSQTLNEQGLSISRLFPAGTIVITIAANIGETAITDYAVAFPDSLVGITPTGIDTSFLEYFLRTQKVRLNQLAPESAQKNINLEDLRPLPTPIPSIKEQVAVAEILNSIQARMEREQGIAEATISSKLAASDALLTGRVRVSA